MGAVAAMVGLVSLRGLAPVSWIALEAGLGLEVGLRLEVGLGLEVGLRLDVGLGPEVGLGLALVREFGFEIVGPESGLGWDETGLGGLRTGLASAVVRVTLVGSGAEAAIPAGRLGCGCGLAGVCGVVPWYSARGSCWNWVRAAPCGTIPAVLVTPLGRRD
jgi:hypothetical protein